MKGGKIEKIGVSFRGMYMRNIAGGALPDFYEGK